MSVTYPWGPVDRYVGMRWPEIFDHNATGSSIDDMPKPRLYDVLEMPPDTLYRWRRQDLSEERADRIATALGVHPSMLWSEWWANVPAEDDG